jgi:hypothetical protein
MKCNPLVIKVPSPRDGYEQTVKYRLSVMK